VRDRRACAAGCRARLGTLLTRGHARGALAKLGRFFNTNNLWVDLQALKAQFDKHSGALPLPVIKNAKTVDPRDKGSTKVLQLETAMGSAISCFQGATAIVIPRSRFAPVKTTADLVALRSDAYVMTADFRIELAPERNGVPPDVKLDGRYKFVDAMDALGAVPSMIGCKTLTIDVRARRRSPAPSLATAPRGRMLCPARSALTCRPAARAALATAGRG